jgi:hypothetical protein
MSVPTSPTTRPAATPELIKFVRSLSLARVAGSLGSLADLAGTWIGTGFTPWPHLSVATLTKQ